MDVGNSPGTQNCNTRHKHLLKFCIDSAAAAALQTRTLPAPQLGQRSYSTLK
jgi:hypothetical protein